MKKRETKNNSTSRLALAKTSSPYNQIKTAMTWREKGFGESFIEAICDKYLEWAERTDAITPAEFRHQFGIPKQTFKQWKERYATLAAVDEIVREKIGCRREKLAIYKDNDCDPRTLHRTLHLYHPDWSEVVEHEEALRRELNAKEKEQKPTEITVVMPDYGSKDNSG